MLIDERYDRQERIEGWDQSKLAEARVTIVGSGPLARYTALPLVALGVGHLRIVSNAECKNENLLGIELKGSEAKSLEAALKQINPTVEVQGVNAAIVNEGSTYFLEGTSMLLDLTNNQRSKAITADYACAKGIPYFSAANVQAYGKILRAQGIDPRLLLPTIQGEQDDLVSLAMGGMLTEEVKRTMMGQDELRVPIYYNLAHPDRFTYQRAELGEGDFSKKKVLMIGAGALGNFVGIGLAQLGVGQIDIMDEDTVEGNNLNRQVLYHDCVGESKADSLKRKIELMSNGEVKVRAYNQWFTENTKMKRKYDAIFDCLDSFRVRATLSDYVVKHQVPLVSGGTNYHSGQVAVYVPGKTSCLQCKMDIHRLADESEAARRAAGCLLQPNASVIMTNQAIGGMMVAEARAVFDPETYGAPTNGVINYDSNLETKAGVNHIKEVCECKSH